MKKEMSQKLLGIGMVLPAVLIIAVTIAWPIIQSIIISFQGAAPEKLSLDNYRSLLSEPQSVQNIFYTLQIVILTVVLTIVTAYLLALYLNFSRSRLAWLADQLYMIPQFIPGVVAVYAMMSIIKDSGAINRLLLHFGINFKPGLMYTPEGIILMNLWFNIPFATMIIKAALSDIPTAMIESARDVGAGKLEIFHKMIFPLSARSALIAATFVFMSNVGSFTTPFLMGSSAPRMLGVALYQEFGAFYNLPRAAAMSVFMFGLCALMAIVYLRAMTKKEKWKISG